MRLRQFTDNVPAAIQDVGTHLAVLKSVSLESCPNNGIARNRSSSRTRQNQEFPGVVFCEKRRPSKLDTVKWALLSSAKQM